MLKVKNHLVFTRYNGDNLLKNPPKSVMKLCNDSQNQFFALDLNNGDNPMLKGNENGDLVFI